MPQDPIISQDGLTQADRTQNEFSQYHGALGQAGMRDRAAHLGGRGEFLAAAGDQIALTPGPDGFGQMYVGCSWNVQKIALPGLLGRLGLKRTHNVDIDLGCMYELQDGTRGALQALGTDRGALAHAPYICLSHDERTGRADGDDEYLWINGANWSAFNRVLIYAYIYEGAHDWSGVQPQITLRVAGQTPLHVRPATHAPLPVVALALIEHVRGGLKLTNLTEYFPGQAEMDRAYGFGIKWLDGVKGPAS